MTGAVAAHIAIDLGKELIVNHGGSHGGELIFECY